MTIALAAAAFFAGAAAAAPAKPAADAIKALSLLSRKELVQLRRLYERYSDLVSKRLDDDWRAGLESGELIEHPEEARLPVRQLEEAAVKRQAEFDALKKRRLQAVDQAEAERLDAALAAKAAEVKRLRWQLSRAKGTCADWSDAVWAELLKVGDGSWDLRDATRSARPWHTAAVACAPAGVESPTVCLALDPWKNGAPDVYDYLSWDQGSFEGKLPAEFLLHQLPEAAGS